MDSSVYSCIRSDIPYVLAGSIRDNGPIPGVIKDAFAAQDVMREHTKKATLVVMVATVLHSIATGNMLPNFYERDGTLKLLKVICVDQDEFNLNKLRDRVTHQSVSVATNAQNFLRIVVNELKIIKIINEVRIKAKQITAGAAFFAVLVPPSFAGIVNRFGANRSISFKPAHFQGI